MMKNVYTFNVLIVGIILLSMSNVFAQEVIEGGNMEDESAWTISHLNGSANADVEFNYNDYTPSEGDGGCFHASAATDESNIYSQTLLYQEVTIVRGVEYILTGAVVDRGGWSGNFWLEVSVSGKAIPDEGTADYTPGTDIIYTIKTSSDANGCESENMDGTLQNDACSGDGIVLFEGTGDTTVVVGVKFGLWGAGLSFDLLIDELSLTPSDVTGNKQSTLSYFKLYPTQFENELYVQSETGIRAVKIVNIAGQTIRTYSNLDSKQVSLDVSGISSGLYSVIISDENNKTRSSKAIKR
jgi:hypothetical protein